MVFFSKLQNYFIGLQQDLNFIVFPFFAIALFSWHCYSLYLVNSTSTKNNYGKTSKNNNAFLLPNYIIACKTGVFFCCCCFRVLN